VANQEHQAKLQEAIAKQNIAAWNAWREANPAIQPDLSRANLHGADLHGANLSGANLSSAKLSNTNLVRADLFDVNLSSAHLNNTNLVRANLSGAKLSNTNLVRADLFDANLSSADLRKAILGRANLHGANLSGATLTEAKLYMTGFSDVDLTDAIGLETCEHLAPSIIDHRTLEKSGSLPLQFLQGIGLPERLIASLPSLFGKDEYHSCFISYSAKDDKFAKRIHADLQKSGARCWFAPHDMPWGGKIRDEIDVQIKLRDKVLLVLSEHSIRSKWVEDEVEKAFEEEQKRDQIVLFPVRLDDEVLTTDKAWASKLRRARNIGDFRQWTDHNAYRLSFARVLRDLAIQPKVS
jgi:hypothetical protein